MAESVPKRVSDVWLTTRRCGVSGSVYWRWARLRLTSRRARRAAPWRTAPAAGRERLANSCISKSLVNFPCGQLHVEAPNRFVRGLGAAFVGRLSASLEGRGRLSTWSRGARACPRGDNASSTILHTPLLGLRSARRYAATSAGASSPYSPNRSRSAAAAAAARRSVTAEVVPQAPARAASRSRPGEERRSGRDVGEVAVDQRGVRRPSQTRAPAGGAPHEVARTSTAWGAGGGQRRAQRGGGRGAAVGARRFRARACSAGPTAGNEAPVTHTAARCRAGRACAPRLRGAVDAEVEVACAHT